MSLRFITGGSGQGKTRYIIDEVIRRSGECPKRRFYVVVPEQFSLEMQRSIAEHHPDHGYMNIDVLSFYRLAYRVFDECGYQPDDILEDLGVSMILRRILYEHEEEFPDLKKNRSQAGFLDELKSVLMEFICYRISSDQLMKTGEALLQHPLLVRKCRELSRLYEYFEKSIEGRFMVTEQILHVLCDFVPESELLSDAVFYFDGFTGFTPVQLSFLKELLPYAGQMNVSVTIPAFQNTFSVHSGEELFHFSEKTIHSLVQICRASKGEVEEPVCLMQEVPPRFGDNPEMICLESNLFRRQRKEYLEYPKRIHITACLHPEQEAEYILHKIELLVRKRKYRYRDFAVLTGDLNEYASAFERQAELLHIPLFVDTKKKMSYHPSIETLRALFHLVERNYSYESVFRYLKSGMSSMEDKDIDFLENYIIASGVRGYSMWSQPFRRKRKLYTAEQFERLEKLRINVLKETEAFYFSWKDPLTNVRARMTALYEQMRRLDYAGKLSAMADEAESDGKYVREKEYREVFSLLVVLLDKIVNIFGDEYLSCRELSELVDTGMESLGLGVVPLSMDQMILGDLKRTRLTDIKVLFIAGLNEGLLPPSLHEGGILSDDEKKILSENGIVLSNGPEEQSMEDEFYMYLAFARPKEELYFSYSSVGRDGKARHPSPVLKEITGIFPKLKVRQYPEEEKRYYFNAEDSREYLLRSFMKVKMPGEREAVLSVPQKMLLKYWTGKKELHLELKRYFTERQRQHSPKQLSRSVASLLFGRELRGSVTRMERYAACPYQYFCIYGIGLKEREEYAVYPVDIGNLFHKALEFFSRKVKESEYNWKNIPQEFLEKLIILSVEKAADENIKDVLNSSARNQYKLNSVKRILERTVKILCRQLNDSDLEPDRFELRFGKTDHLDSAAVELGNGVKMHLEGCIDRVDIYEDENSVLMRVIDYKSGVQVFDMDELYHGLQLQLVVYMKAAGEIYKKQLGKPVVPAGMYYYQLKDPIIRADRYEDALPERGFRMSGYTNSSPQILDRVEHGSDDFVSASVRITKKGVPYKSSAVLSTEDFHVLEDYALKKTREMGAQIYEGRIEVLPYRRDKRTACDYCPYASVCGFDPGDGQQYHEWKKQSLEETLEAIRKQVD